MSTFTECRRLWVSNKYMLCTSWSLEHYLTIILFPIFSEANAQVMQELLERFPKFTQEKISDLKLQFTAFDLNHDGLIDYHEM